MSVVEEDEATRRAEEEERSRQENELLREEEPMEEGDEDKRVQEVRLEEIEKAINETCTDIKNQTKFSTKQCRVLLSPLIGKILEVEEQFRGKKKESEFWEKMNVKLNKTVLSLQNELEGKRPPQLPTSLEEPTATRVLSGQSIQGNEERIKLVSLLEANEIHTEAELNKLFEKYEQLEYELSVKMEYLQRSQRQTDSFRSELCRLKVKCDQQQQKLLTEEEKVKKMSEDLKAKNSNLRANSSTRGSECNQQMGERKESTRYYNADTSEIIDTIPLQESLDSGRNWNQRIVEQSAQRNIIVHNEHEMSNMNAQWRMAQALPDPPVFSAGKNSVNAETFERAFYMKYRFFDIEAQKNFLETRFLAGNALTVYKGLPESDKNSVSRILDAIKRRLSQSEPEESRRAKSKFQALKLHKEQTVQDFCLIIDEVVRVGYKGVPEYQISSMKTTKLLDEMREHTVFEVLLQILGSQLRNCPVEEQYELCRVEATMFDEEWRSGKRKAAKNEMRMNRGQSDQYSNNVPRTGFTQNNASIPQQSSRFNRYTPNRQSNSYQTNSGFDSNSSQCTSTTGQQQNFSTSTDLNNQSVQKTDQQNQGPKGYVYNEKSPECWKNLVHSSESANNASSSALGFHKCSECNLTGCHAPTCSRAPGSNTSKVKINSTIVCFRCDQQGHIASKCPTRNASIPEVRVAPEIQSKVEDQKFKRKSDTKCSSDKESERELIDHEMETKDLCEGQSIAARVFKKDMVIGVDRVPIKSINSIEFSVMSSDEMLRSGDTKDDGLQTSCTKHAHTKDNNVGVNGEFTEANSQKNGNCDEEQKSERDQRLCSISLTKTKKRSVQQKKVSDVISSFGDLKRDQNEQSVQKSIVKCDSIQSYMSSEDGDGEKKRNTVDQKAVDNVMCQGPPLNSIEDSSSLNQNDNVDASEVTDIVKINTSKSKFLNQKCLTKPGLQKTGDDTCGVDFPKKTKRRNKEETRPRTDPPVSSPETSDYDYNSVFCFDSDLWLSDTSPGSMDSDNDNQLDSYQAWKKSVPKMFKSQVVPRPLKNPPVCTNQSTWSDTQFEPAKESPRPLKDPPDSWMEDVKWRRMQQEYRPRKDPPSPYCQHGHRNLLGCLQYTQFLPTPMSTVSS
ncbi:hypothetical protein CRE_23401 [Caenorhabditis remanei]|uniref:CCHC-type domain-containing protein n=1 Tax=Caenorhabditis remanei TaxID=31234 RepID=E3MGL6_CAERE|nr:hypothetical protein CRE_23401 [Caenorhabditis remanei]